MTFDFETISCQLTISNMSKPKHVLYIQYDAQDTVLIARHFD